MPKLPAARSGIPSTIQSDIMPDPASDANGTGASNGLPAKLKPYHFHKLTIDQVVGSAQAIGDCPFCGKEGKLTINQDSGLLHCFVCGIGGNPASFLKLLHDASDKATTDYKMLAADRKLLYPETLMHWAAVRSIIDDQWLIPGYCAEGKLHQLYRQTPIMDKGKWTHRLLPTPGIWSDGNVHGLHGVNQFDPDKPEISLTEGVWDGLALWEIMRITKRSDGHLVHTASDSSSLLASHNVLAVPGCKIFSDKWLPLFKDKVVNLWYDSDHPRINGNKSFIDGLDGMKRVTSILNSNAQYRPPLIRYLKWGEQGYDSDKPSGYDVRDALASGGLTEAGRIAVLSQLLDKLTPVPDSWLPRTASNANGTNHNDIECLTCTDWNTLVQAWRKAMKWTEGLDRALSIMLACILSTRSVGIQLWAKILSPASGGKSTLCEAISVNKKYVKALSTIRGFHSGFKEGDGGDNKSLILRLRDKTLVTKDGDTLLQSPNKDQILSEARDIFDRTSRSDYRNGMGADHEGINMTWILCGTSALRAIDTTELGSRFLDCVIMESIDNDLEEEIGLRAVNAEERAVSIMCNGTAGSSLEPELVHAMQLTGGYIDYLCNNENGRSEQLLNSISPMDNFTKDKLRGLGTFVAYIRARPSTKQQETSGERELSARLIRQHTRLAKCLAVVLSKKSVDREVMRRVRHTALDTARGRTLEIVKVLCQPVHHSGVTTGELAVYMNETDDRLVPMLKFLKDIAVVKQFDAPRMNNQMVSRKKWTVTDKLKNLYAEINKDASGSGKGG